MKLKLIGAIKHKRNRKKFLALIAKAGETAYKMNRDYALIKVSDARAIKGHREFLDEMSANNVYYSIVEGTVHVRGALLNYEYDTYVYMFDMDALIIARYVEV